VPSCCRCSWLCMSTSVSLMLLDFICWLNKGIRHQAASTKYQAENRPQVSMHSLTSPPPPWTYTPLPSPPWLHICVRVFVVHPHFRFGNVAWCSLNCCLNYTCLGLWVSVFVSVSVCVCRVNAAWQPAQLFNFNAILKIPTAPRAV